MTAFFSRWLPAATLFTWSAILLFFFFTARLGFLHPSFRPGVLLTGIVLLLLGLANAWTSGNVDSCEADDCGHPLGRNAIGRALSFLMLLLPIGTAAFYSPQGYSARAIQNRGIISDAQSLSGARKTVAREGQSVSEYLPKTKAGNLQLQVIDLIYAAQDSSLRHDFENKTVEMIGQIMPNKTTNITGNRFKLVRMIMRCCAADAQPVAAAVEPETKQSIPEMSWVKVIGEATFPIEAGRITPVLKATSVQITDPPEETMLY